ncbi:MAG TPA: hypothetical protein VHQ47_15800 [Phycisphaerae bacterium]|nr:hypothetical protein [Phycisphaerae bacterium]
MSDECLLARFVESFGRFEELLALESAPAELDGGPDPGDGYRRWKPVAVRTEVGALEGFYARIPGPLPALFEKLALSYRWLEVYLDDDVRLLANPPGAGLGGLAENMAADPVLRNVLFPLGLVPFGRAGGSYDPLCFDLSGRVGEGDCRVVRVEHESVLCNERVGETWMVAESFRLLVGSFVDGERAAGCGG